MIDEVKASFETLMREYPSGMRVNSLLAGKYFSIKQDYVVVGNGANYILNFNEPLRVDREVKVQPRRVVYGGYLIADGNKKPNAFAYGKVTAGV